MGEVGAAPAAALVPDPLQVGADGADADVQLRGDLGVGAAPGDLATGCYGLLRAGTITVTTGSGQPLTLPRGTIWSPHHTLRRASRRAILIHIDAHEIRHLISPATTP